MSLHTYRRLDDGLLGRLGVPVALFRAGPGTGGLLTDADVEFIRAQIPGVRIAQLHDVGHGPQLQAPEQVAHALRQLIADDRTDGFPARS
ncbi:hypothetical protein KYY02_29940 [Streptomyces pimonensis]|uniref:Hydrolase n=1 Tax=Streptomyces pimonensis TaxID=2860288 RepID=A0ABV4JAQ3_9ACTN